MRKLSRAYGNLSIIHATFITKDIGDSILDFLSSMEELFPGFKKDKFSVEYARDEFNSTLEKEDGTAEDYLYEVLFRWMDKIAPPGYYFGAHPGDGSDFGFWEIEREDWEIDVEKVKRRIKDALHKTATDRQVLEIAKMLNVKID